MLPLPRAVFLLLLFPFRFFSQRLDGVVQSGNGFGGAVLLHVLQLPDGLLCGHGTHPPLLLSFYHRMGAERKCFIGDFSSFLPDCGGRRGLSPPRPAPAAAARGWLSEQGREQPERWCTGSWPRGEGRQLSSQYSLPAAIRQEMR